MTRAYYSDSISNFLVEHKESILGKLITNHTNRTLEELQRNAWIRQIEILKDQLEGIHGTIYFEFSIPRMGKRVDNIIIIGDCVFVVEFKVGSDSYDKHAIEQLIDYSLDLRNFHEGSHSAKLIPVLIATEGEQKESSKEEVYHLNQVVYSNQNNFKQTLQDFIDEKSHFDVIAWEQSIYKPTPTIVEAAQALYKGHNVEEISRSDAGAINLSKTAACLNRIIEYSKANHKKSICFVTGVPGARKTLAGLNIANERLKADEEEHAVFLSGNGPLVDVLREALARDVVESSKKSSERITKKDAKRKTNAFIQNIHHFRDEYLKEMSAPIEKVVVFDEAQRAWTQKQVSSFMSRKKGIAHFEMSEPEFLVDVMDRHKDWCTIVCLIGGGQEINTGEAGLSEWVKAFQERFEDWDIHYSNLIVDSPNYIKEEGQKDWLKTEAKEENNLHLGVSIRSFRSEKLSAFIHHILELNLEKAQNLYNYIKADYPILMTRNLDKAKQWLKEKAKGSERYGLIASSGAKRLRPFGIDVKNSIEAPNWFLNPKDDIRSSFFLEDVATEFDIQGLEIDWSLVAWGANFHIDQGEWQFQNFKGTKWMNIRKAIDRDYLKNTYRVLLTRARQGMIIFLPEGNEADYTRPHKFYEGTYHYFKAVGIKEL
jgi:hypothetical protein